MNRWISDYIQSQHRALDSIPVERIRELVDELAAGRWIFVMGNGGIAANASLFATDVGKNVSKLVAARCRPSR